MKKILFITLFFTLITSISVYSIKFMFPIQYIITKNKITSFFGFTQLIKLPTQKIKKNNQNNFGFPTIHQFQIVGFNNSKKSYTISGEKLSIQNKKILNFYTPLIKEVQLKNPKLIFNSNKEGQIVCTANNGLFDQKTINILMKDQVFCTQNKLKIHIKKLKFNGKLNKLTLYIKNTKIHII
ncbi:MAG: hypothetical protein COB02_09445 [Candidatus Cloacimonadota bacterium]|nr:MAG: hypothetical protein COB02_09445 [Candidatus Cloacimonadota bacterium]